MAATAQKVWMCANKAYLVFDACAGLNWALVSGRFGKAVAFLCAINFPDLTKTTQLDGNEIVTIPQYFKVIAI